MNRLPSIINQSINQLIDYPKLPPLPPTPLAVVSLLVTDLVACRYFDRLDDLLGFCCLVFVSLLLSVGVCVGSLVSQLLSFAVASLQPSVIAQWFEAFGF